MTLRMIRWDEAPPAGDAADFAALGGGRASLEDLLRAARPVAPRDPQSPPDTDVAEEPWREPPPFDAYKVPAFPTSALPPWLRNYVSALAVATQTPPDLAGLLVLAVVAVAAARRVVVSPRPGWLEPLVLYVVAVLSSGTRKSAVFADATAPILDYERELRDGLSPRISALQQEYRLAEGRLKAAEAAAIKAASGDAATPVLDPQAAREALDSIAIPASPQLLTDDVTAEALGRLLAENRERMGVFSAEGDLFDLMAGRYSDGRANLGVFLKGHAGDLLKVNRVGRAPDYVHSPALTLAITTRPNVLAGLSKREGFRGTGLLARLLFTVPRNLVGSRAADPPRVPGAVRAAYVRGVRRPLAKHDPVERIVAAPNEVPEPSVLTFEAAARKRHVEFQAALEPRLGPNGDLSHIADWAGKLTGLVARLAGLLHLAALRDDPDPSRVPISLEAVNGAIALGEYALGHALVAFGAMGADPSTEAARRIWRWVAEQKLTIVRRADLYQALRGTFPKSADLDAPLALLVEYGYLRPVSPTVDRQAKNRRGPQGRPPSASYEVNPLAPKNAGNAENVVATESDGDFRDFQDFQPPRASENGAGMDLSENESDRQSWARSRGRRPRELFIEEDF